jgi:hypothetical protein
MAVVAGLAFGVAVALYLLSHFDSRVKKHYALAAFVVALVVSLADAATTQIAVGERCEATGDATTYCHYVYTSDFTAVLFAVVSALFALLVLVEMSVEAAAEALWP